MQVVVVIVGVFSVVFLLSSIIFNIYISALCQQQFHLSLYAKQFFLCFQKFMYAVQLPLEELIW